MSNMSMNTPPFGVGAVMSRTFGLFFSNFQIFVLLAAVPVFFSEAGGYLIFGSYAYFGGGVDPAMSAGASAWGFVDMLVSALVSAILVNAAFDASLGRSLAPQRYLNRAAAALFPVIICALIAGIGLGIALVGIITGFIFSIAMFAFAIPGLWLFAALGVATPAIVVEGAGFGGLKRSWELTKEYRWPVLGALTLLVLCSAVIVVPLGLLVIGGVMAGTLPAIALLLVSVALTAIAYALWGVGVALIYARLREIKDGLGTEALASVFD